MSLTLVITSTVVVEESPSGWATTIPAIGGLS